MPPTPPQPFGKVTPRAPAPVIQSMSRSPYGVAARKWSERFAKARTAGIDPAVLYPVAKYDIERVGKGSIPLSDFEAGVAVRASQGQQTFPKPERGTGLFDIPGNIVSDIGGLARGLNPIKLVPALGKEIATTVTHPENLLKPAAKAVEKGDLFAGVREAAKTPGLRLIPGFYTAANLSTKEGREEVVRHPATTVLDVLPYATGAGKLATTGRVGRAGRTATVLGKELTAAQAAGDVARVEALTARGIKPVIPGTAREAFGMGRPLRGTARALIPDSWRAKFTDPSRRLLQRFGVDKDSINVARKHSQISRETALDLDRWHADIQGRIKGLPDDEQVALWREATEPDLHPNPPAHRAAMLTEIRQVNRRLAQLGDDTGKGLASIPYGEGTFLYPRQGSQGKVIQAWERAGKQQERYVAAQERLARIEAEVRPTARASLQRKIVQERQRVVRNVGRPGARAAKVRQSASERISEYTIALRDNAHLTTNKRILRERAKVAAAQKVAQDANQAFFKRFARTPPASFQPMMGRRIIERVVAGGKRKVAQAAYQQAAGRAAPGTLQQVAATINRAIDDYAMDLDPYQLVSKTEYNAIKRDVAATWLDLANKGMDPVWTHHTPSARVRSALSPKPLSDSYVTPKQLATRTLDPTPKLSNIAVSLTTAASEYLRSIATERFVNEAILPYSKTNAGVRAYLRPKLERLRRRAEKAGRHFDETDEFNTLRANEFMEATPEGMFGLTAARLRPWRGDQRWIPKHVARAAEDMLKEGPKSAFGDVTRRATSLFKVSVVGLSPRHVMDVVFADTMLMLMRGGKEEIVNWRQAWRMAKNHELPIELPRTLDVDTAERLFSVAAGKKQGLLWKTLLGPKGVARQVYKMEEFITNVQRFDSYMSELERGVKGGLDRTAAHQAALNHTYKTIVDLDGLAPIERTLIRQVFPFYSFTRYILRYTMSYPVDHPMRAAIIGRLSDMERRDWDSGLPELFQHLFQIGDTDAEGNVTTIDARVLNPFRDVGNYLSWAGFLSSLNPAISAAFEISGVDPLTATPMLYPDMKYNPQTGRLQPQRPDNPLFTLLSNFIPQTEIVNYAFPFTERMRDLKAGNEEAYKRTLWRSLFLPFLPRDINIPEERAKSELQRMEEAQRAVSEATRTGAPVSRKYPLVPYRGEAVPTQYIDDLVKLLKEQQEAVGIDVAPKATNPPSRRT